MKKLNIFFVLIAIFLFWESCVSTVTNSRFEFPKGSNAEEQITEMVKAELVYPWIILSEEQASVFSDEMTVTEKMLRLDLLRPLPPIYIITDSVAREIALIAKASAVNQAFTSFEINVISKGGNTIPWEDIVQSFRFKSTEL